MIEISLNPVFSIYFGVLFLVLGGIILCRLNSAMDELAGAAFKRTMLQVFGWMIISGGVICFLLSRYFFTFHWILKIPLYGIVGTSISFTFTFALLDAINFCVSSGGSGKPLIESPQQIYLILGVSVFLGAIFGFIFGCMDVEDFISVEELRGNLMKEERICLPIGALTGALGAYINKSIAPANSYSPLDTNSYASGSGKSIL